jgi:integrase
VPGEPTRTIPVEFRTLPLDDALVDALKALRKRQAQESAEAGLAYAGEYAVTNVLGEPLHSDWYSDEFGRLLKRTGLRRITVHYSRHAKLTLMELRALPISVIRKCAGHYDAAFTQQTYVHESRR